MTIEFFQDTTERQFFEIADGTPEDDNPHLDTAYSQDIHSSDALQLDAMMTKMPDVFHEFFELDAA